MKKRSFDVGYWEDVWDKIQLPQEKKAGTIHEFHRIFQKFLPAGEQTIIEIGCAPGSWLAYFHRCFGYSVSGIEYAPKAFEKTTENLQIQDIPREIFLGDFFKFEHEPYDVVFSSGFIEHYEDVTPVVQRIVDLCAPGGLVVTIIPGMQGINWWISRLFRPHVAAGHFPISRKALIQCHEACGLTTRYCHYVGSGRFLIPVEKNKFSREHPTISAILNLPFRIWNRAISVLTSKTGIYPRLGFLTESTIYIGQK